MKKIQSFKQIFQMAVLLSAVLCMCVLALGQPDSLEKRADEEDFPDRNSAPEARPCDKRVRQYREKTVSFCMLYGLEDYDIPEKRLDFGALREEYNPHIYAWITIPDTVIDYPVLQHPEQPDYYLAHNLDGSAGYPGCIYTQPENSRDWSDNQTVIYGHNMRDGSMFAGLHLYEDADFLEENPYIYIYTGESVRIYRIFAAYPYSDEHLLYEFNTDTQSGYEDYLELVRETALERGHYIADAAPETSTPVITLSTCIADRPAQRYLVQAALEAEGKKIQ